MAGEFILLRLIQAGMQHVDADVKRRKLTGDGAGEKANGAFTGFEDTTTHG
jgi:hypothetical protein